MTGAATFGGWLLVQVDRGDEIGELARTAAADADFPRDGDYLAVLSWAWEAPVEDQLLEVTLPVAGGEHEREARR